jgi:predicted nucleic acid-binding protein
VAAEGSVVPGPLELELHDTLLMTARRGRLPEAEIVPSLLRLRHLRLETADMAAAADTGVVPLAARHRLTVYDATYLALARDRSPPLATSDPALRRAAEVECVDLV